MDYWDALVRPQNREFLSTCTIRQIRGSGKGGQKRNKTSNTVQLSLLGMAVVSGSSRSLEENKKKSIFKLKLTLALDYGFKKLPGGMLDVNPLVRRIENHVARIEAVGINCSVKNPQYPLFAGYLTDTFLFFNGSIKKTADVLKISVSALYKKIESHPRLKSRFSDIYGHCAALSKNTPGTLVTADA